MSREIPGTHQKALQINIDAAQYGTFVEIGAGQEVARWFFRVGGASGTIAKTMSAYDITISDAIYGPCERYVSRQRLESMLEREYELLLERLESKRGDKTKFFIFADTVATRGFKSGAEGHGWLGIRFQTEPRGEPSQILLHARLLDPETVQEQESLGVLGVNLIHAAMYLHQDPFALIDSLLDNLTSERIEVDMIKFSGPKFADVDNRIMALHLVQKGLTKAAMFTAKGEVVRPADELYKKCIIVERGSFRPITHITLDMLNCATGLFVQEPKVQGEDVMVLMEMTLKNLTDGDKPVDHQDFLARVDILSALGKNVLISNYLEYYRLAGYLFLYTKKMIGLAMGVPSLREVFDEKYYTHLEGGILESFGRLFKNDLKLYVYPLQEPKTGALITAGNLRVAPNLRHLYAYLVENRFIESLRDYNEAYLPIFSRDVLAKLRAGDPSWEAAVPPIVAQMIRERRLFNYKAPGELAAPPAAN
ncbi:MAG: TonB-dependent receptor [Verrucomicrobia bacterium]|nr:TonB-dependent receptor [Verrucomicrobiota bacterium]